MEIAVAVHRNMRFLLLGEPTASQRYRASGLNPVIATITLWNTVYLERAAEAWQDLGLSIIAEQSYPKVSA